jgi:mono/diheme cytochrome c family protein
MQPSDFRWQVANAQPPGTSDTSQVASDHIDNPSTINNIAYLNVRPMHNVITADGVSRRVFNILKDGADSVGAACLDDPTEKPGSNDTACAALRGYLNIGVCAAAWTALVDPIDGISRRQAPFDVRQARRTSPACDESWSATAARLQGLEAFLRTLGPLHLADADNTAQYMPTDQALLNRGRIVFAEQCARCHSSKRPPAGSSHSQQQWLRNAVQQSDFLEGNFLSDDERYPVSQIGTNSERALASNAVQGHLWQQFSSETYKQSPPVRVNGLPHPLFPVLHTHTQTVTGGAGYYRTPTLVNVWATAPFLHNNSVGLYNGDPSIAGRLAAYEDGMEKLLSPRQRQGSGSIHRTTQPSRLQLDGGSRLCIARNTPIDLITNVEVKPRKPGARHKLLDNLLCPLTGSGLANGILLLLDNDTDFTQDRGHTFGANLPTADKHALIEYMKTF